MSDDNGGTGKVVVTATGFGWGTGWLFTVGFAKLGFWKAVVALALWPALLGQALSS